MARKLKIGFTYGDPSSIGPEILLNTLLSWDYLEILPILIGDKNVLCSYKKSSLGRLNVLEEEKVVFKENVNPGKPNINTGKHAYECMVKSVDLIKNKKIDALVTGPVSKSITSLSYPNFKGQTDALAKLLDIKNDKSIMTFIERDLRIALYTRHIPIRDVPSNLTSKDLIAFVELLIQEHKYHFKRSKKIKIGILGLNPHAGEDGLIGCEELAVFPSVLKTLRAKKIDIIGPLSPDATLAECGRRYLNNQQQKYDFLISMYHDQCLPMFKAVTGLRGLNVTLGLPILRVSPDHGTAFDIAGKNIASNEGIVSSIEFLRNLR